MYKLSLAASPHIAARKDNVKIDLNIITKKNMMQLQTGNLLIIEGAGGLLVPLNENEFVIDLIQKLNARVILVQELFGKYQSFIIDGCCMQAKNINVVGWIFNDQYMNYEDEIVQWSGYEKIASILYKRHKSVFYKQQADK